MGAARAPRMTISYKQMLLSWLSKEQETAVERQRLAFIVFPLSDLALFYSIDCTMMKTASLQIRRVL